MTQIHKTWKIFLADGSDNADFYSGGKYIQWERALAKI
jgi:hypothetical protein